MVTIFDVTPANNRCIMFDVTPANSRCIMFDVAPANNRCTIALIGIVASIHAQTHTLSVNILIDHQSKAYTSLWAASAFCR